MSENAIVVDNLSKRYLIGHQSSSAEKYKHTTLREVIGHKISNIARKATDVVRGRQVLQGDEIEEFWALKDVSFDVKQGEVLGIIGRNGAGKSTLLKILSRITEPTGGRVLLRGRVSSLLEVGTGFHPELTGRENIFLNGAILGMTQREIRRKFDEIVAFADIEKFIDTPVKRYSSGMYVRLAFAVAAHLEPDILIVDEVLAVGDVEFQKKCLGKMDEFSRREGRTVLLVSHNLAAISELTRRAILLDSGRVVAQGTSAEVVSTYYSYGDSAATYTCPADKPTSTPHVRRIEVVTTDRHSVHRFGEPLELKIWINHQTPMRKACLTVWIYNQFRQPIVQAWAYPPAVQFGSKSGVSFLICRFPSLRLNVGKFYLRTHLNEAPPTAGAYEDLDNVCPFEVIRTDTKLWGWGPNDCAYHEQWAWRLGVDENSTIGEIKFEAKRFDQSN
jgi:lipopolysaccharide transport system ATP-binding protein